MVSRRTADIFRKICSEHVCIRSSQSIPMWQAASKLDVIVCCDCLWCARLLLHTLVHFQLLQSICASHNPGKQSPSVKCFDVHVAPLKAASRPGLSWTQVRHCSLEQQRQESRLSACFPQSLLQGYFPSPDLPSERLHADAESCTSKIIWLSKPCMSHFPNLHCGLPRGCLNPALLFSRCSNSIQEILCDSSADSPAASSKLPGPVLSDTWLIAAWGRATGKHRNPGGIRKTICAGYHHRAGMRSPSQSSQLTLSPTNR